MWRLCIAIMAGCGRISFDPTGAVDAPVGATDGARTADAAPEPGLLLHFAFESDGLMHDRAPAHHEATCTTCPTTAPGPIGGGAASFAGGACLTIADAMDLRPPHFTVSLWLDPASASAMPQTALSRPLNGATAGTNTLEMFVDGGDVWKLAVNTMSKARTLDHGVWHHVLGTFDGDLLTMYVDGAQNGAPLATGPASYAAGDALHLGCDVNSGIESNHMTGLIDEVRLYDRVLDATEIATLAGP